MKFLVTFLTYLLIIAGLLPAIHFSEVLLQKTGSDLISYIPFILLFSLLLLPLLHDKNTDNKEAYENKSGTVSKVGLIILVAVSIVALYILAPFLVMLFAYMFSEVF